MNGKLIDIETEFQCLLPYKKIALAVSGGADSIALMYLLRRWKHSTNSIPEIIILTVDHGLRDESADEAQWVKQQAEKLKLQFVLLLWEGDKPSTAIQEEARNARYRLMTEWCKSNHVPALLTAHHLDDQAETVLMRLLRGSGIDGMSGIPRTSSMHGIDIIRPLLAIPKKDLVAFLQSNNHTWIEDPSNNNSDYERVRVRKVLAELSSIGLNPQQLGRTAERMLRARRTLDYLADQSLEEVSKIKPQGYVTLHREQFLDLPEEVALRCLAKLLSAVSGRQAPALQKTEALYQTLTEQNVKKETIAHCVICPVENHFIIAREVRGDDTFKTELIPGTQILWDHRFHITVSEQAPDNLTVQALTEKHYLELPIDKLKENNNPELFQKTVRASLPSFWIGEKLVFVPHLEYRHSSLTEDSVRIKFHTQL